MPVICGKHLNLKHITGTEDDETSAEDNELDDDTLFEDLDDVVKEEVSRTIDRHCIARLSCFAHSIQLVVKDGMDNCSSVRPVMAKCCKIANFAQRGRQSAHDSICFSLTIIILQ